MTRSHPQNLKQNKRLTKSILRYFSEPKTKIKKTLSIYYKYIKRARHRT